MLGKETVQLLELLGLKSFTPSHLAELVLTQYGPDGLLFEKSIRNNLIDALNESDASRLARLLQLSASDSTWNSIKRLSFSRNKPSAQTLFAFFGFPSFDFSDKVVIPNAKTSVSPSYSLFNHQINASIEVIKYLTNDDYPRVFLHMPTGSGKTRTAMNVISYFLRYQMQAGQVVVWLAHSEELCDQAAEEFEKAWSFLGNREISVFRCYGPHSVDLNEITNGIVIAGLQLLYQRSLSHQSDFFPLARRVPLIIMDEAHQAIAPTYKHLLNLLVTDEKTAILGLSATPGRSWLDASEDLKLAAFFNSNKVTLQVEGYDNPVDYLQQEGYLAKVDYEYLRFPQIDLSIEEKDKLRNQLEIPEDVISRLSKDHSRNFLILSSIMDEADKGSKILVFACTVDHANLLADLLASKGYKAASITSKTRADRRRHLIFSYRDTDDIQILTNYGVLTTGFDAPKTNTAIITRPTKSVVLYSQMVGRAARGPKAGGNEECKVITVIDDLPGFRSIAESFTFWEDIWT